LDLIEEDGIAAVGAKIEPGQVFINKQEPVDKRANFVGGANGAPVAVEFRPTPLTFKSLDPAVIDKVISFTTSF
jgi:DNA-directed RNA polymerase III subunit RPC2